VNFLFVRQGEDGEWKGEMREQSRGTGGRCSGVQRGNSHQRSNRVKGRAGSCQREIKGAGLRPMSYEVTVCEYEVRLYGI
jgi:hypothetical protein